MPSKNPERIIRAETIVDASLDEVWNAWTTEEGIKSFLAPACNIGLRVDSPYEIFFDPEAEPGQRGSEGAKILAFQPGKMLSFTWSAPPHLSVVRKQWNHVTVRLEQVSKGQTKVALTHDGWGEGREWDEAFEYFTKAWVNVVLPRLKHRFAAGPVDWNNPPKSG